MLVAKGTLIIHGTVMLILQAAYSDVVAPDSIKAMTVRIVVWVTVLFLMFAQNRKDKL
jgi:hypothetical protein